jgi:hypothetical protein
MIKPRAAAADLPAGTCCHTFSRDRHQPEFARAIEQQHIPTAAVPQSVAELLEAEATRATEFWRRPM